MDIAGKFIVEMKSTPRPLTPRQGLRLVQAQLKKLHARVEDLADYLDLLEARERNAGKPTLTIDQVRQRLRLKKI